MLPYGKILMSYSVAEPAETAGEVAVNKAVINAVKFLQLSQTELGEIIGLTSSSVSRFVKGQQSLHKRTKPYQLALLLVRVFRSLDAISGGDERYNRDWLRAQNLALGGVPLEMMRRPEGLADVLAYLDSRRALV